MFVTSFSYNMRTRTTAYDSVSQTKKTSENKTNTTARICSSKATKKEKMKQKQKKYNQPFYWTVPNYFVIIVEHLQKMFQYTHRAQFVFGWIAYEWNGWRNGTKIERTVIIDDPHTDYDIQVEWEINLNGWLAGNCIGTSAEIERHLLYEQQIAIVQWTWHTV